jgi:site-specific DNA-methyltransferase (adenine-specific)
MTVQLICGDCLQVLPRLEPQSVDAIITDIPYGSTACVWDVIIPFEPMWAQVKRVLKPRGVFVTTASQPFTSKLVMSNLEWFKYEWIWEKARPTGFQFAKYCPMREHENILVFGNGSSVYNPEMTPKEKPITKRYPTVKSKSSNMISDKIATGEWTHTNPKTIIKFKQEGGIHPTQKPVALYAYLIRTYTNEGDTVLDSCMGSGTTMVACVQTGRNGIGIELREDYFAIAEKRIAEAQLQVRMPI